MIPGPECGIRATRGILRISAAAANTGTIHCTIANANTSGAVSTTTALDTDNSTTLQAVAALAIGLIYVGTCDEDAANSILQTLMEKEESELENPFMRIFALGLGLLFLGQQSAADASMEVCKMIPNA